MGTAKSSVNPKMINISDIKGKRTGLFLIHMTGKQWKKAIGKTLIEKFDPVIDKDFEGFTGIPLGDDPLIDGIVIFPGPCSSTCKINYTKKNPLGRCECPDGGHGGFSFTLCHLEATNNVFTCAGNCVTGNCHLRISRGSSGRFEFFRFNCVCGI